MDKPKILFWDIETSLMKVTSFSLYPKYIPHSGIIEDFAILGGAWRYEGEEIQTAFVKNRNDRVVVKKLAKAVESADILCGHNADKFDLKKLKTRMIYHDLPPLKTFKPMQTIDTLKIARKEFSFSSNRLDYLGKFLKVGGKLSTPPNLWQGIAEGDFTHIPEMEEYCANDVELLIEVYKKLAPWSTTHPSMQLNEKRYKSTVCEYCLSSKLQRRGYVQYASAKRRRIQCTSCGKWSERVLDF